MLLAPSLSYLGLPSAASGGPSPNRYYSLLITDTFTGSGTMLIEEVELLESFNGGNVAPLATVTCNVASVAGLPGYVVDGFSSKGEAATLAGHTYSHVTNINNRPVRYIFDFGAGYSPAIAMYQISGIDGGNTPSDWTFESSPDGVTWTVIDTVVGEDTWAPYETKTYYIDGYTPAYTGSPWGTWDEVRFQIQPKKGNWSNISGATMEVRATPGGADQLGGATVTASSTGVGSAANMVDGNNATEWGTVAVFLDDRWGEWIKAVPAAPIGIGEIRWVARAANGVQAPIGITLQARHTGGQWTTIIWWNPTGWTNGESRTRTDPKYI
ncbi:hypothetical protein [Phenylobacterium sp.]|uniref:hypothetical protein n=1 Tax=Phenylobacterium sp. TaxID=1871053 RepID=UPI002FCBA1F4